tara:strand:- start:3687 stop:4196 length:510 start_codon:yes stop_codon:yes gene_type:complete
MSKIKLINILSEIVKEQSGSSCEMFESVVASGVLPQELCQSYYDVMTDGYTAVIPEEVIEMLSLITDNGSCCPPMPDLSLNCQSLYDLPQWMRDKFCYKCETDDLDALYGVDQLPWAGGPYGEFDASYCACCEEKPYTPVSPYAGKPKSMSQLNTLIKQIGKIKKLLKK